MKYSWDARNQLRRASSTSFGTQKSYDALGRRQTPSIPDPYFNDMVTYVHDGATNIASSGFDTGTQMLTGLDGEVLSYQDNGSFTPGTWVPLHDGQGNTIATINSSGTMDTTYTYDPFGQTATSSMQGGYSYPSSLPYLYQGMEFGVCITAAVATTTRSSRGPSRR